MSQPMRAERRSRGFCVVVLGGTGIAILSSGRRLYVLQQVGFRAHMRAARCNSWPPRELCVWRR